jgi:radical SAM superfamily enzyme YgiQ (UPF0313 family)
MPGPSAGPTSTPAVGNDVLLVEDLGQQRLPARALAAVLRQAGFGVQLVHFGLGRSDGGGNTRAIVALAEQLQPRLVLLSILFGSRIPEYLALAGALRGAGLRAHISMAGPFPSFAPSELLAACPALDSVLCGEAEASVVELTSRLDDPAQWSLIPGLAYRAPGSSTLRGRAGNWPALVANLDSLPFPAHDGRLPSYLGYGFTTVEGSRGCYHACSFCLPTAFYWAATGSDGLSRSVPRAATEVATPSQATEETSRPYYRSRSVCNLVDELEALYRQGARLFLFDDEQFLPPTACRAERIDQLERELARRGLEIAFTIKCRADDVEAALFRQLRRMGLLRVYVGVESGCQASLDLFSKGVTAERNIEALATLDDLGIVADFYDLLFHPWSTLETVETDAAFCQRVAPHISTPLRFNEVGVLPGTRLADRLRIEGRCRGEPWSWSYELADPRVEVLRRLNRLVFAASAQRIRTERRLTELWYALLLERRFQPARFDETLAGRLREVVARLNRDWLVVWSEMLEFARAGPIRDAGRVNNAAGRWAAKVNAGSMRAAAALEDTVLTPLQRLGLCRQDEGPEGEVTPSC